VLVKKMKTCGEQICGKKEDKNSVSILKNFGKLKEYYTSSWRDKKKYMREQQKLEN